MTQPTIASEIERYLRTGDADMMGFPWLGDFTERARRQHADIRGALLDEVRRRAKGRTHEPVPDNVGVEFTRGKVEPMVRGLFPKAEQDIVLAMLEKSVVYVTSETIEHIIMTDSYDHSAWELANLYLLSVGAELLGPEAPRVVGISEHMTCYVSPEYFAEDDPFADFVVHEAAHVFHNCKRHTVGLRETRTKEWLLDIEYRQRETFAYSCEAYARVLARAKSPAERRALAADYGSERRISEERVDPAEVASIVAEAADARNGWKVILARCAPVRRLQSSCGRTSSAGTKRRRPTKRRSSPASCWNCSTSDGPRSVFPPSETGERAPAERIEESARAALAGGKPRGNPA